MPLDLSVPTPLSYFQSLVQSDEQFPLLEAAASLAQIHDARADVSQVLEQVDRFVRDLQQRVPADSPALHRLTQLNVFFYEHLGFAGNANDYYAPANSDLTEVLRTRRGIPISLAVIWLELAQSLRIKAFGVSFPQHFVVKVLLPQGQVVMDPLTGQFFTRDRLIEMLDTAGLPHSDNADTPDAPTLGDYLQSAAPREIITRMLRNLHAIHQAQGDERQLREVLRRATLLWPDGEMPH